MGDPAQRLVFVLPIALSNTGRDDSDLLRAQLLWASLDRYFNKSDLERLIIVSPARDLPVISQAAAPFQGSLRIDVVDENDICPELATDPVTLNKWPKPNTGWFRQQLIKLAIHRYIETAFYITLDCDVLFVRNFSVRSLIKDGRADVGVLRSGDFEHTFRTDVAEHEVSVRYARMRHAEGVLGMRRPAVCLNQWYGETPVILSRDVVSGLVDCIEEKWQKPWRSALLEHLPWTEYCLYFLYAEASGLFERYHAPAGPDCVLRFSQSLWQPSEKYLSPRDLANWDPQEVFDVDKEGVAVVVQSYLGYPVSGIAQRVAPFLYRERTPDRT